MGSTSIRTLSACCLVLLSVTARGQEESQSAQSEETEVPEERSEGSTEPGDGSLDQLLEPEQPADSKSEAQTDEVETIPVAAQPETEPEPVAKPHRGMIEEIVVTAQKREQDLQDVPIAMQAFSGEDLVDMGVSDSQALQNITPGLVYNSNAGYAQAYVRGIGSDATIPTADPSVATYVDGVYYPFIQSTIQSFGDVSRIEVLKGPQGTLYGRNSTGGAINIVTKEPSQATEWSVDAEVGNYNKRRAALFGSLPLFDFMAVSVSGFVDDMDALYEQTNPTGPEIVNSENFGLRGKLALNLFETFNISLTAYSLDRTGSGTNVANAFDEYAASEAFGAEPTPTPYKANADLPERSETAIKGANLRLNFEGLPWFDVKSIAAYQDVDDLGFVDYERSPRAVAGFGAQPGFAETVSEELQFLSKDLERFEWVAGGFYLESSGGFNPLNFWIAEPDPTGLLPPTYTVTSLISVVDTTAKAVFGQLTWTAFDWLKLTGGLRYSTETRELVRNEVYQPYTDSDPSNAFGRRPPRTPMASSNPPRSATFSALTPKVGVELPFENLWITDSALLYMSYSEGFKSGTFNPVRVADAEPPPPVEPEEMSAYEIGLKSDLLGGSMRLNVAGFTYDYRNLQLQFIELTGGGAVRLENSGRATVQGVEMEFLWVPLDGLTFSLNGAWQLKAIYDVCDCTGYEQSDPNSGQSSRQDFSGNEMMRSPDQTLTSQLSYSVGVWGGELEAAVNGYYNSGFWFDVQNVFFQEAYELYGARLSYKPEWADLKFSLFGNNLTDELYLVNGNVNDFSRFGTYGTPRTFGLRFQWTGGA